MITVQSLRVAIEQLKQLQAKLDTAHTETWTDEEADRYIAETDAIVIEALGPTLAKPLLRLAKGVRS